MNHASEKSALVLEIGSTFVKCGLSEERAPRGVVRWEVCVFTGSISCIYARACSHASLVTYLGE